jgi:hypothetical protein
MAGTAGAAIITAGTAGVIIIAITTSETKRETASGLPFGFVASSRTGIEA